ncbi:MAG: hypothetical protein G01um101466_72 [Parcubacteria group bacterium Gr01-1014_66]|nr:MAG: hypothetical protein G01um101466_72 [Parcubacteria group bacterium Gr01-1014_66]
MNRRIIIFAVGILLGILLIFGVRFFLRKNTSQSTTPQNVIGRIFGLPPPTPAAPPPVSPPPSPPGTPPPGTPPVSPDAQVLRQLTTFPVVSPSLNPKEDKIMFYKKEGGELIASDFDGGTQERIADLTIVGMIDAVWGLGRDRAAVRYLDQETIKTFLHIGSSSVVLLPQDITSVSWSPDKTSLVYTRPENGKLSVVVTDTKGNTGRVIAVLPLPDAHARWITKDDIELLTAPSGRAEGYSFFLSRTKGTVRKIIGPRFGLLTSWAPDGSGALVFSTRRGGHDPHLEYYDAKKNTLRILEFTTLPEKCVWVTAKQIYCAAPTNFVAQQTLPDEYLTGELLTQDTIISYTIESDVYKVILASEIFDIIDLRMDKNQKYLFFIDRRDGTLWRLKLK